jgi:hypothetical protein
MLIKSITEWDKLAKDLTELGYSLYQWQYDVDGKEGFHSWFMGKDTVEVVTFSREVKDAILRFGR